MTAALVLSLSSRLPTISGISFEIVWKAAILCLAVWVAHVLAGRNRVLLRSALWHLCLVGLVLLPVAVVAFPRLDVATRFTDAHDGSSNRGIPELESDDGRNSPATAAANETAVEFPGTRTTGRVADTGAETAVLAPTFHHFGEMAVLAAITVYLLTLAILLIGLAASLAAVAALRRESTPVVNPAWREALDRWHSQFALRPHVQLLQARCVSVPIVVGWCRPAILLPPGLAETTDRQAIDAVLLHELTHVARGDYAWNLLLRIVSAMYWLHPGVWLANHMVRLVREEVCDAVCVRWMGDARAYCRILAEVAVGVVQRSEAVLGMAMTHSSQLGRRLARVEHSPGSARGLLGRPARTAVAALVFGSVCLLGSAQMAPRASAGGQELPAADRPAEPPEASRSNFRIDPISTNQYVVAVQDPDESKPPRVATVKVKRGAFERTTTQPASLEAFGQISIHSRNSGIVSKVLVDIGDRVKAGDVLAELDVPDLDNEIAEKEAALAQAEAAEEQAGAVVEAARAAVLAQEAHVVAAKSESDTAASYEKFRKIQYERIKKLYELKSVEERIVDEKEQQLRAAEAGAKSAAVRIQTTAADDAKVKADVRVVELALKAATLRTAAVTLDLAGSKVRTGDGFRLIRCPIDGVVLEKNVEADVLVKRGDGKPLFRIAALGLITAVVQLPERDALHAKRGSRATVQLDALDDHRVISGKISRLAYGIDPTTRTLRAEITLPNAEGRLKPGMFGRATIVVGELPDVLWVPASALFERKGIEATCIRVVNGRTVRSPVKLGQSNDEQAEIIEGLTEGDAVIVGTEKALPDDLPVEPILLPAFRKGT